MKNIHLLLVHLGLVVAGQSLWADKTPLVAEKDTKLHYANVDSGDQIPDFSYCGYKGGGVALPDAPVKITLSPQPAGDDTERLQKAINTVGSLSADNYGIRGAVLLKAGTYRVSGTLLVDQSGVVLRGEGQGDDGTIIIATGKEKRTLINLSGKSVGMKEIEGSRRVIAQNRVAVGARTLKLESTLGLRKGDRIIVFRAGTKEWISRLGTDKLNKGPKDPVTNWTPESYNLRFERTIEDSDEKTITLDAPIVCAIEKRFGGGYVYTTSDDQRLSNSGIEYLRLVSEYQKGKETRDEDHAWDAIKISKARDSWVRNVTAVHFGYSCVNISGNATQITVQDSACIDPVSKISGGRRYSFAVSGQRCLIQRCYTRNGRHDYVMHARVPGPNVFLDCVADKTHSDSGPHHRWATGTLYDNLACGALNVQWRGRSGTGHGWAGANMVFWNCRAKNIRVDQPPTANNYAIGCTGTIHGKGYIESHGKPVSPRSLYLRQLEERLGKEAVSATTLPEQLQGTIDVHLRKALAPNAQTLYK